MELLKGVGVSTGIAIGKALLILDEETVILQNTIAPNQVAAEIQRFFGALEAAKSQLHQIKNKMLSRIGEEHAFIFDTHILFLDDNALRQETEVSIRTNLWTAEFAFSRCLISLLNEFDALEDAYFVERANDLKDVGKRLLQILVGGKSKKFGFDDLENDVVVIGYEFGPSNITNFDNPRILGFATDVGAQTTHTAIIARALGLPAVVGLHHITKRVQSGDTVILDSFSGNVIVNPDAKTHEKYRKLRRLYERETAALRKDLEKPAISKDGLEVMLRANIELPNEVDAAIGNGAKGVGLYRTEFLFLECAPDLPSEEIHYQTYCGIAEKLAGAQFTIRTLDLGGEKFFHRTFHGEKGANPVLGLRGVRLCLQRLDVFGTQLRAILRVAKKYQNVRIMFPLITCLDELRDILGFLEVIKADLRRDGVEYEENPVLGIMIEVPSAALMADILASEVDFFSIGTNDLIQYFMAIDRSNDDVAYLYDPLHPGLVRLLSLIIDAAQKAQIDLSCCGEMASSPIYACLLILLGMRNLSMNPASLPLIHHTVRAIDFTRLGNMLPNPANQSLGKDTMKAFRAALRDMLEPGDFKHLVGGDLSRHSS